MLNSSILFILFGLSAGFAASASVGPGYAHWSSFKPGTSVTFQWRTVSSVKSRNMILTVRLKSVDPDRVVLGYEETPLDGPDAFLPGKEALIEFKASEFSRAKEDLFHGVLSTSIAREMAETDARYEKEAEVLTVKGMPIRADRIQNEYRIVYRLMAAQNIVTIWRSDAVPGKLLKIVREIRTFTARLREEVTLIDFSALPASAEEVGRLQVARNKTWVEASAATILLSEARYFDELADLRKFNLEWDRAMAELVPRMPHMDMSEFHGYFRALRDKVRQWKAHWAEDRPSIEAHMDAAGKEKIGALLEAMSRSVNVFDPRTDWMDRVLFLIDQEIGLQHLRALQKELPGFRRSADAVTGPLLEKLKNVQDVTIAYLR
jgi:hypothetical protein